MKIMKGKTKVKSIFDPLVQKDILCKARLVDSAGCVHSKNEEKAEIQGISKGQSKKPFHLTSFQCSLCKAVFEDLQQQRLHFKSDWHVYNIRRKMHSLDSTTCATITDDFLKVDEVFKTSIRSVDDTDDEDDDVVENHGRKAKITFITDSGHYFSVHRQLLETDTKDTCSNCILHEKGIKCIRSDSCWIILMMSGGHFAAAVFHKQEVVAHKAIHRYVVRAKRGTVQSQRDGKQSGKSPRSAGAHIRRQNEIALIAEIQELLQKWKDHIDESDRIFLKWPQRAKAILFDGKERILSKSDPRITKVPFVTGKPTFDEVKRTNHLLSTFTLTDSPDDHQLSGDDTDSCGASD